MERSFAAEYTQIGTEVVQERAARTILRPGRAHRCEGR